MWPWEHAAAGYLLYSVGCRALGYDPPEEDATIALVVATLVPDLVDKPLSWGLGVFPTGYAVGHSLFVAIPLGAAALVLGRLSGRQSLGVAFVVGYWSHLLGDVLNPLRTGEPPDPNRVFWPVVEANTYEVDRGIGRGVFYLREFLSGVPTMGALELLVMVGLPAVTAVVWLFDGTPGVAIPGRLVRAIDRRFS
ncbi:metal-dependent hydrolase [Haloarcula sp. GH36]|uniref:metal-dependent hydrolase n=1 Tax=Haloarcula montana TaxID=3111776 RepID=UPI002D7832FE|nr:metal-dependent hydrolase [Haloarcula sp. GH36]